MARFTRAVTSIQAFSETDLTEDPKRIDVPILIVHSADDQIAPISDSAMLSSKIVRGATLNRDVIEQRHHVLASSNLSN